MNPLPPWGIALLILGLATFFIGIGAILWFTRTKSIPDREEARREIDLERASLEREAQWMRKQRKAKHEEIEEMEKERGADVEVDKPTGDEGHTGQKVVVAKLAKSDDVV